MWNRHFLPETSLSAPNKNTFSGAKYNGFLSGTVQFQQQITFLRIFWHTHLHFLYSFLHHGLLWNPISLSLVCVMIYKLSKFGLWNMIMVHILQTLIKQPIILGHTKIFIFWVYYVNCEYQWMAIMYNGVCQSTVKLAYAVASIHQKPRYCEVWCHQILLPRNDHKCVCVYVCGVSKDESYVALIITKQIRQL